MKSINTRLKNLLIKVFSEDQNLYCPHIGLELVFIDLFLLSVSEKPGFQTPYGSTIDNGMVSDLLILTFTSIAIRGDFPVCVLPRFVRTPFEPSDARAREAEIFEISSFVARPT